MSPLAVPSMIDPVDPSMPSRGVLTFVLVEVEPRDARILEPTSEALIRHGGQALAPPPGDGGEVVAAFHHPDDALAALSAIGTQLGVEVGPEEIRVAVHTGSVDRLDQVLESAALARARELLGLVPPGRILLSSTTQLLLDAALPSGMRLRPLTAGAGPDLLRCHELHHEDLAGTLAPWPTAREQPGLPTYATSFIGRQVELTELAELLGTTRLLTVTGTAGAGKTRLVHATLGAQRDRFRDGAVWVDLTTVDDPRRLASEVASCCGLSEGPGGGEPLRMVTNHLRSNHRLVVLDNCEHILEAIAELATQVLAAEGDSVLLATSREPIGIPGELTWRIPSLGLPDPRHGSDVERASDAIRLFVERASSAVPTLEFDEEAIRSIGQICRRLDGIPLAIELAAPRLRAMPVAELATGLDNRFRLLTSGPRSIERQRTLQASIDWSHDLLDHPERVAFRRLAVFAGPFDLADAEAVISEPPLTRFEIFERVASLVDKSLVQSVDGRYLLLESIRAYAGQKAADAGELEGLRDGHLRHLLDLAARWEFDRRPAPTEVLEDATRHGADLRLALSWAQVREPASVVDLLTPLVQVLGYGNLYDEVDALVQSVAENEPEGSEPWCMLIAASIHYLSLSGLWWTDAASRALTNGDLDLEGTAERRLRYGLIAVDMFTGSPGAADTVAELIEEAQNERDELFVHQAGVNLAYAIAMSGDLTRAEPYLAWIERNATDAPQITTVARGARSWIDTCRCDVDRVSAEIIQLISEPIVGPGSAAIAVVGAFYAGSIPLLRALRERVRAQEFNGFFEMIPYWIDLYLALLEDDIDAAQRAVDLALALPIVDSFALVRLAAVEVALSCGDLDLARQRSVEESARTEGLEAPFALAVATCTFAQVARLDGDHERATELALHALEIAHSQRLVCVEVTALETLALVAAERGQHERAGRMLGACNAFRARSGYLGRSPYLRLALEGIAATLDPEHLLAGAGRTLEETIAETWDPGRKGHRPVSGLASLTPAEGRVAALAADGLTTREIAESLFVSNATVKTHLVHVYQKLGVRSRAQLVTTYLGGSTTT